MFTVLTTSFSKVCNTLYLNYRFALHIIGFIHLLSFLFKSALRYFLCIFNLLLLEGSNLFEICITNGFEILVSVSRSAIVVSPKILLNVKVS